MIIGSFIHSTIHSHSANWEPRREGTEGVMRMSQNLDSERSFLRKVGGGMAGQAAQGANR